jgi:hypothetical protein
MTAVHTRPLRPPAPLPPCAPAPLWLLPRFPLVPRRTAIVSGHPSEPLPLFLTMAPDPGGVRRLGQTRVCDAREHYLADAARQI